MKRTAATKWEQNISFIKTRKCPLIHKTGFWWEPDWTTGSAPWLQRHNGESCSIWTSWPGGLRRGQKLSVTPEARCSTKRVPPRGGGYLLPFLLPQPFGAHSYFSRRGVLAVGLKRSLSRWVWQKSPPLCARAGTGGRQERLLHSRFEASALWVVTKALTGKSKKQSAAHQADAK